MTVATHDGDDTRWLDAPVESGARAGFGVYLHVPFCHHRCGYCDFAVAAVGRLDDARRGDLESRYVAAVTADLARQVAATPRGLLAAVSREGAPTDGTAKGASGAGAPAGDTTGAAVGWSPGQGNAPPGVGTWDGVADAAPETWPEVTSIYIGGGTPTLLAPEQLARLVTAVRRELDVAADAEVTVEANPETASSARFGALAEVGVNRLSIGAQSFTPHVLRTLERGHGPDAPLAAVAQARAAGIADVSLDLMYGTPGESAADWESTLAQVLLADVQHVSAYALTIHEGTPFGRRVDGGLLAGVDEDRQAARFERLNQVLTAGGFEHYEVSNLARGPGARSRHNLLYWRHGHYLGVGAGAHGHLDGRRWWSQRSTPRYIHAVEQAGAAPWGVGASPLAGTEVLNLEQRAAERLLLGLRVREGIHPCDLPPISALALEDACTSGLVETACGRLRCTDRGWFLLDDAVDRLTAW